MIVITFRTAPSGSSAHPAHKDCLTMRKASREGINLEPWELAELDSNIWEMDTVEGKKGEEKVILTLYLRSFHFMLGFLLDHQNMESVLCQFHWLKSILGIDLFRELCPVILTDNDSEFKNPVSLEESLDVEQRESRTRIFYYDPGKAYQKGGIEKNHEFIRYAIPKGRSLEGYTQEDLTLLMDHINSYSRNQRAFFYTI